MISLPPGLWWITPGNGSVSRAQCWSLQLTDWALSSGHSQVSLYGASPCCWTVHHLYPATTATLCLSPLGNDGVAGEEAACYIQRVICPLSYKVRLC
jgi:hypothetical protein